MGPMTSFNVCKEALNIALYARKKSGHKDMNSRKYWQKRVW